MFCMTYPFCIVFNADFFSKTCFYCETILATLSTSFIYPRIKQGTNYHLLLAFIFPFSTSSIDAMIGNGFMITVDGLIESFQSAEIKTPFLLLSNEENYLYINKL